MPKSKNRKNHKERVASRLLQKKQKISQKINKLKRIIEENKLKQKLQDDGIEEDE